MIFSLNQKWIIFLCFIFSSKCLALHAWEEIEKPERKYWSSVNKHIDNKSIHDLVEFNYIEKTPDGRLLAPFIVFGNGKTLSPVIWLRLDCDNNIAENIGSFSNGNFSLILNPINIKPGAIGSTVLKMVCGITPKKGFKIFGIGAFDFGDDNYGHLGFNNEEIKVINSSKNIISTNFYFYKPETGEVGQPLYAKIDCINKTLTTKDNNIFDANNLPDNTNATPYKYAINKICRYNNLSKSSISETLISAKQQCKDLGFKPGTEKFGNCVLELIK